ncbi:MAG: Hsp20 family protein [Nitrospirae bacterium]|nr:Hsp20 family protein [Nitrospirota bacterium]
MNREDIDISVADEVLTIKGKRHSDDPKAEETYHRRERWTGQFSKNIVLPFRVENSRVEAKYQKGVLTIVLPREAVAEQREERTRERRVYTPAVDIIEGKDETTVIADMPGVDESSVDITLEKNILEIYGKVDPDIPQGMRLVISEYGIGDYHRRFTLSDEIDRDRIQATVKNGVLRLILPRAEKAKTRKIEVRAGQ